MDKGANSNQRETTILIPSFSDSCGKKSRAYLTHMTTYQQEKN